MLRKFNNLPVIGSVLALLMFSVAVAIGLGVNFYRFGIAIPVVVAIVFVWSLTIVLKNAKKRVRRRFYIGSAVLGGVVVIFGGFVWLMVSLDESIKASDLRMEALRKVGAIVEPDHRVERVNAAVEAQKARSADRTFQDVLRTIEKK